MMLKSIPPVACLFLLASCVVGSGEDQLIDQSKETVSVEGVERILIDVTSGILRVQGESRSDVVLEAEFWGQVFNPESAQALLKNLSLTHQRDGADLIIKTRAGEGSLGENGWIDLQLRLPGHLPIEVADRGGDITISGIQADLVIADSRGDIEVSDIGGSLSIEDTSGDITVAGVVGPLTIADSSGEIGITDAGADVSVEDTYGDILIATVAGSVVIDDGSGDITVRSVEGDFQVKRNRRGDIVHEDVKGTVTLPKSRRGG